MLEMKHRRATNIYLEPGPLPGSMPFWLFLLLALEGLGAWTHHTEWGRFVVGMRCSRRPVVSPVTGGRDLCEVFCPHGEWSQEIKLTARSQRYANRRESGRFVPSWKRWSVSEYSRGLRHQASSREFKLKTSLDHHWIPGRRVTTRETDFETARRLYYSFLICASGGRDTTTYTFEEDMTQDITWEVQPQANGLGPWSY